MFLILCFKVLPYVSAFHVKNCVQNHALLLVSPSPWPVLFVRPHWLSFYRCLLTWNQMSELWPKKVKIPYSVKICRKSRRNNFQKDFFSLVCDFFCLITSETKDFSIQNGASLSAGGKPRKPCAARNHQDLTAAGGKSGKPCPELPAAQLPPSREASGGGSQTRVRGHDLLSHHGGVQRSKKVSSVQGCGSALI